ncbi:MAG: DUF799 family lipoprotein [Opitutaceae bacterium]|nr:DUF799 family lipoprotein [Opitutaceae bacterium]
MKRNILRSIPAVLMLVFSGCTTIPPKDYTAFRQSKPRSILVLPPINETTEVGASYSLLTTTTHPLCELGYYVMPVAVVDQYMKENGLSVPAEMHQAPMAKLHEVFGADAVLYITVTQYGSKYQVFASNVVVAAKARLVDCRSGVTLWEGTAQAVNSGQSGLIEALVTQVLNKLMDQAHMVAAMASYQLLTTPTQGLLKGPRHLEYGKD